EAWLLKADHVELAETLFPCDFAVSGDGLFPRIAWLKRNGHRNNGPADIRPKQRNMPGYHCTPIVTHDDGLLFTEGCDQANHVPGKVKDRVVFDGLRPVCAAVASHIRRHGAVSRLRQGYHLMPPGIGCLRKAVTQQHQGSGAGFGDVHAYAVDVDRLACDHRHAETPLLPPVSTLFRGIYHWQRSI